MDWFDRAAAAVLAANDQDLVSLAVPVARVSGSIGERAVADLALLERARRQAVADPGRDAEFEREGAGSYRSLLANMEARDAHGQRLAALVRKRPQPRRVKIRPWAPPWLRGSKP